STDGSSSLPKESTVHIGKASRLLEMGDWGPQASIVTTEVSPDMSDVPREQDLSYWSRGEGSISEAWLVSFAVICCKVKPQSSLSSCLEPQLCGCGLLGVGIWLSVSQGNFATFSPSFPSLSAANLVIAIGTIVMVTGFLGCLGAIKENKCLLLSFFIVLLAILLAELILLILFFVYMDKVNENAKQDLKEGLLLYNTENNVGLKNAWNIIQAEMRCCGVTDYTDWYPVLGENIVPDRCCMENSQGCGRNTTTPLWRTGCYEKVKLWFNGNKHVLGTVGMCILIMQILGMAFSMTLFQHIHRTGKKYDA
ncbi:hypothetical protein STEG23_028516, partial [Scotinomys teguina]